MQKITEFYAFWARFLTERRNAYSMPNFRHVFATCTLPHFVISNYICGAPSVRTSGGSHFGSGSKSPRVKSIRYSLDMQPAFVASPMLGQGDNAVGGASDTSRIQNRSYSRFTSRGQPDKRGQARGLGHARSRGFGRDREYGRGYERKNNSAPVMLAAGEVVRGRVSGIAKFGAFVELDGGVQGLVHISELSQSFVRDVLDVVRVGDEVNVRVLSVDEATGRIALSIKQCDAPVSTGYDRAVELGGDWGQPWGDDSNTKFMDLGPRPPARPNHWQPDVEKFRPFDEPPPAGDTPDRE